jgi:hypothetical protein
VALLGAFFRGQGVRQGAMIVGQAVAEAKQLSAKSHRNVFLVFSPVAANEGWVEIHKDLNEDGNYQGDNKPNTPDADPVIEGGKAELPKFVTFHEAPSYIVFSPSGYMTFGGGFKEIQASTFDAVMNGSNPKPVGDVILKMQHRPYFMCTDLDRASGKMRRSFFLNQEQ